MNFLIGGTIVNDEAEKWAFEDVAPAQVRSAIKGLKDGEEITFDISSPGGSVVAGVAIANLIRSASRDGHKCTAHIIGVAASMASVVACACDEIVMEESAFMMIHNPWASIDGNANDLRKCAAELDQMRDSILSFYRSKFDKTDDEIKALLDAETWFTGREVQDFGFKATVIPSEEPLKAAACARNIPGFSRIPKTAEGLFVLGQHEEKPMNEITIEATEEVKAPEVAENAQETPVEATEEAKPSEDTPAEEKPIEGEIEAPAEKPEAPAAPEMVALAECEKRVSGMQSAMAKQIEAVKAEYEAKMAEVRKTAEDFKIQLAAKDEELIKVNAEITRLAEVAKKAEGELQETASALKLKEEALATLNARVNTPAPADDYQAKMAKAKTAEEREALRDLKRKGKIN